MVINRFEVYMIDLDPTQGSEINKPRPCVIVSPDELNSNLKTVIAAPLTSSTKHYPSRVDCYFQGKQGQVALDQIRCLDKTRLKRKMGVIDNTTAESVCEVLQEMFQFNA